MRWIILALCTAAQMVAALPPGVVIHHSPVPSGLYVGSPSIVILGNGDYLASNDLFGPNSREFEAPDTLVHLSRDRGESWQLISRIHGQFWSGLFVHSNAVFILGTDRHHGHIVIRRSMDNGRTWTEPKDSATGRLSARDNYHTAPTPVIEFGGRIWRAFEDASGGTQWGARYIPLMLSVPADRDLLNAANWLFSKPIQRDSKWLSGAFSAWLEGNAVVTRDGKIVNILRVDVPKFPERTAIVQVADDGTAATFDPERDIIDFPGGAKKFTIRFDPESNAYWSLATVVPQEFQTGKPASIRNTLALVRSKNLRNWEIRKILAQHPDIKNHGFQYADWQFDGADLVAAIRTAFDDESGGAHNFHDANYLIFLRVKSFR